MRKDKTPSIYLYNSDEKTGQACGQAEHSNLNGLEGINEQVNGQASGQYKKELLKRIYISKDIYVPTDVDLVIEKWNLLNLYKPHSYKCMK